MPQRMVELMMSESAQMEYHQAVEYDGMRMMGPKEEEANVV